MLAILFESVCLTYPIILLLVGQTVFGRGYTKKKGLLQLALKILEEKKQAEIIKPKDGWEISEIMTFIYNQICEYESVSRFEDWDIVVEKTYDELQAVLDDTEWVLDFGNNNHRRESLNKVKAFLEELPILKNPELEILDSRQYIQQNRSVFSEFKERVSREQNIPFEKREVGLRTRIWKWFTNKIRWFNKSRAQLFVGVILFLVYIGITLLHPIDANPVSMCFLLVMAIALMFLSSKQLSGFNKGLAAK